MDLTGLLFKHEVGSLAVPGGLNSDHRQRKLCYVVATCTADYFHHREQNCQNRVIQNIVGATFFIFMLFLKDPLLRTHLMWLKGRCQFVAENSLTHTTHSGVITYKLGNFRLSSLYFQYWDLKFKPESIDRKSSTNINLLMCFRAPLFHAPPENLLFTYLPSARLMERKMGYSSGAGWPCWSSYRKMGPRPTSTPSCWMPCWLYMDNRKDWRPVLALMVNMMEKSCGKTPPGGQITSVEWHT